MNDPIDFNNNSASFAKVQDLSQMNSGSNSLSFGEIDSRFLPFDLDSMNFNSFEGTLESRINQEINSHSKKAAKINQPNPYYDQEMTIPTSPLPTSPIPTYQYTGYNAVSHTRASANQQPLYNPQSNFIHSFQEIPGPDFENSHTESKPLVLYPFKSIYDVELAVQQMREFEGSRFD